MTKQNNKSNPQHIIHELPIRNILIDTKWQFRDINDAHVARLAAKYRNDVDVDPITVGILNGVTILVDGWHRVQALKEIERSTVKAIVRQASSAAELRCWSFETNTTHGRGLTSKELRRGFRLWIKAKRHRDSNGSLKSYRQIAREIGGDRSHVTIRTWMQQDFPRIFRAMLAHEEGDQWSASDHDSEAVIAPDAELAATVIAGLKAAIIALDGITSDESLSAINDLLQQANLRIAQREWTEPVFDF